MFRKSHRRCRRCRDVCVCVYVLCTRCCVVSGRTFPRFLQDPCGALADPTRPIHPIPAPLIRPASRVQHAKSNNICKCMCEWVSERAHGLLCTRREYARCSLMSGHAFAKIVRPMAGAMQEMKKKRESERMLRRGREAESQRTAKLGFT